jgi:mono/diheme cytochrome c family protein
MNYKYLLITIFSLLVLLQCACSHKVAYNIPTNYPEDKRKELMVILDKGKKLYKENCSECHGIFTKGKDKVPNFSSTQIDSYSARFLRRDPKNHAVVRNMSPEQMNDILAFLRYKKTKITDSATIKRGRF